MIQNVFVCIHTLYTRIHAHLLALYLKALNPWVPEEIILDL